MKCISKDRMAPGTGTAAHSHTQAVRFFHPQLLCLCFFLLPQCVYDQFVLKCLLKGSNNWAQVSTDVHSPLFSFTIIAVAANSLRTCFACPFSGSSGYTKLANVQQQQPQQCFSFFFFFPSTTQQESSHYHQHRLQQHRSPSYDPLANWLRVWSFLPTR